jgi:hypothetical protein
MLNLSLIKYKAFLPFDCIIQRFTRMFTLSKDKTLFKKTDYFLIEK